MNRLTITRLARHDTDRARAVFAMMATVFEEDDADASRDYVAGLLRRDDFLAVAAFADDAPVGGLTGFLLPTARAEGLELFIYDIAVLPSHQRIGLGRRLVETARQLASAVGAEVSWVAADNEDTHALDFYRALGGDESPVTVFTFR